MPNFHYLGKNGFPNADNVNVYDYQNDIDYGRYDYSQMIIQVCSVPWDQGEAHIGQRTISGLGNVVHFGSAAKRDAWFDAIPDTECFRWETKFKELHSDLTLRVPLPFDIASNYNYVRVTYSLFANDDSPLQYESENGMRKWFYFIREARFIAPNTTELLLLDDAWQTWIYSMGITNMILERGHAPMFATKADAYLANPIANCSNLLSEDINYGELQKVTKAQATALNAGVMYAVVAMSGDPKGSWGAKYSNSWQTPAPSHVDIAGAPALELVAMAAGDLNTFLDNVTANMPQLKQTIQCVFFCAKELLSVGTGFAFAGVTCYQVAGYNRVSKQIFTRSKADWGYGAHYKNLAKLYTYPYSALEITDEKGNSELVRIEDTSNALTMDVAANLVFPYLNLSGVIHGIGGTSSSQISFANVDSHTFNMSGRWYEHLREWSIPGFSVILSAAKQNDFGTHFSRIQQDNDRSTAKTNADASATTASSNSQNVANAGYNATVTTATAARTTTNNTADNLLDNATAQTTANDTINSNSNSTASQDAALSNALAQAIQAWDAGMSRETVNNEANKENATAAVGAAGGVVNSVAGGAISGFLTAGPVGAAAGAIGGLVSGGLGAATSLATNAIAVSAMSTQAEAVISNSQSKLGETQQSNIDRTNNANSGKTANKDATNTLIATSANNTAATSKENATTSYNAQVSAADTTRNAAVAAAQATETTTKANNARTYNNEGSRITNSVKQAALGAPAIYGSTANGEFATTRPMGLFVNVVTESDYAIQRAGDEFLRYGYYLDKQWPFDGNWLVGKYFSFWKLRDYWSSNQIPDRFSDQLRFLLFGGVTVWRRPDDIGKASIYDNGI